MDQSHVTDAFNGVLLEGRLGQLSLTGCIFTDVLVPVLMHKEDNGTVENCQHVETSRDDDDVEVTGCEACQQPVAASSIEQLRQAGDVPVEKLKELRVDKEEQTNEDTSGKVSSSFFH